MFKQSSQLSKNSNETDVSYIIEKNGTKYKLYVCVDNTNKNKMAKILCLY